MPLWIRGGHLNLAMLLDRDDSPQAMISKGWRYFEISHPFILFHAMHSFNHWVYLNELRFCNSPCPLNKGVFFVFMRGLRAAFFYAIFNNRFISHRKGGTRLFRLSMRLPRLVRSSEGRIRCVRGG